MTSVLKVGIAGLGNVGASVARLLQQQAALLENRTQKQIRITAISARTKEKNRGVDLSQAKWFDNPVDVAASPDVDVVVELIGGTGVAFDVVKKALELNKPVVTANKALLAVRSAEIIALSKKSKGSISFEAAVAGGIPVIKALREGLAANDIRAVYGILNGTCNFILSEMFSTGRTFAEVLKEAQDKGYAEADPSFDVDGVDAAHKLAILSGLAFGGVPDVKNVDIKGIRAITSLDITSATELGCRIKLLGIAKKTARGIEQSVEPCLVPDNTPIATVEGALNAVYMDGDYVGKVLMTGAGAGGNPTASAVVADIIDVARGRAGLPLMGITGDNVAPLNTSSGLERKGAYYIRLVVLDQPGVFADILSILGSYYISLESVLQRRHAPGQAVPVILTTHKTSEDSILQTIKKIGKLQTVVQPPYVMRIEEFMASE